jgi:hypothetical protein
MSVDHINNAESWLGVEATDFILVLNMIKCLERWSINKRRRVSWSSSNQVMS